MRRAAAAGPLQTDDDAASPSARARRRDASTPARQAAASCEAQPGVFNYGQLTKALMALR